MKGHSSQYYTEVGLMQDYYANRYLFPMYLAFKKPDMKLVGYIGVINDIRNRACTAGVEETDIQDLYIQD
jgi:hypothetical protein